MVPTPVSAGHTNVNVKQWECGNLGSRHRVCPQMREWTAISIVNGSVSDKTERKFTHSQFISLIDVCRGKWDQPVVFRRIESVETKENMISGLKTPVRCASYSIYAWCHLHIELYDIVPYATNTEIAKYTGLKKIFPLETFERFCGV